MKAREIIRRPLLTEKTTMMQEQENTVCFEVDRRANKIQVRHAVEELFDVASRGGAHRQPQGQTDHALRPGGESPTGHAQGVRQARAGLEEPRVLRGRVRSPRWR